MATSEKKQQELRKIKEDLVKNSIEAKKNKEFKEEWNDKVDDHLAVEIDLSHQKTNEELEEKTESEMHPYDKLAQDLYTYVQSHRSLLSDSDIKRIKQIRTACRMHATELNLSLKIAKAKNEYGGRMNISKGSVNGYEEHQIKAYKKEIAEAKKDAEKLNSKREKELFSGKERKNGAVERAMSDSTMLLYEYGSGFSASSDSYYDRNPHYYSDSSKRAHPSWMFETYEQRNDREEQARDYAIEKCLEKIGIYPQKQSEKQQSPKNKKRQVAEREM